ncbi:MAG TPA: tetratricopeptide repeat protein [Halalkalibaculum sp.]|nr:tetratricopeptide repeat protein [Halalkalibaculum sp.]
MLFLFLLQSIPVCCQSFSVDTSAAKLQESDEKLAIEALLEQSDSNVLRNPEKAISYAREALALSIQINDANGEIKSLYLLGELNIRQGNVEAAKPDFEMGLEISTELGDSKLVAEGFYHLSKLYEVENNFSEAINYLQKALDLYETLGLKTNIAQSYSSFGRMYQQVGNYTEALHYYFRALRINEELDRKLGISIAKTNIGNVYLNTEKFDDALTYFEEALTIDQANDDREGILINTLNIGVAKQKKGLYDEALKDFRSALSIAEELGYKRDEAILLGNIGSTLRQQGNLEQGLTYLFLSLSIRNENNYDNAHTLNDISASYLELEDYVQAESFARQAIESSQNSSDLNQLKEAYYNYSKALEGQGSFESAFAAMSLYDSAKDSLFSLEKQRQMDELEVIYETEKNEQEIKLLTLEKETAEFRRNTYLASGLALTFILMLLYYGQRQKSKKNRQLLEKEQEVAEMKSNFFSNISHEFRTPLTLISGPIASIKAGTNDLKTRTQLDVMEKNADRLLSLINQLLDLSSLESGKLKLSPEMTDMLTLVKGVTMTFQSLAEMKHINLTVETELSSLKMNADREKIETILINLVNNAFDFTPEGGNVAVSLGVEEDDTGRSQCLIGVKDTGEGIPLQNLSRVFDRFYRGEAQKGQQKTGTGIGLALTKELVELHGGSIDVFSTVHQGTEFVVTIPSENMTYENSEPDVIQIAETSMSVMTETRHELDAQAETVSDLQETSEPVLLLIEDNEDVTYYLKEILGDDYRVIEAADGEQGVEAALEYIPDLIISDVMMPKMDGYRVAEILKQDEKTSHIPLILLTAKADQKDKMQGLKAHADEYLTKPFRPEELRLRIQNILESRRKLKEKFKMEFMLRPEKVEIHSMDDAFLLRVRESVDNHIDNEDFTVDQLGKEVGMSRSQLHRKLTALIDQSATEFIRSYRLHRAKDMISQNGGTISEISFSVGFGSPSYFSKCFREEFGFSPTEAKG